MHAHAQSSDRVGQPADQGGGLQPGAPGRPRATTDTRGRQPRRGTGGVEQLDAVDAAVGLVDLVLGAGPAQLGLAAGQDDGAAPGPAAADALGGHDAADLVHGAVHGVAHGQGLLAAVAVLEGGHRGGEQGGAPAAVAARRAVAGDVGLHHGHPQVGAGPGQVVGGPQPGVPGADDADVDVGVALEHVGGQQRVAGVVDLLVPHRQRAVPAHPRPSGQARHVGRDRDGVAEVGRGARLAPDLAQRDHAGPDRPVQVAVLVVRVRGRHLERPLLHREAEQERGRGLLARGGAGVGRAPGHEVLGDDAEGARDVVRRHRGEAAEHDHAAVVHRGLELAAGQHEPVQQRDGQAGGRAGGEQPEQPGAGGAVDEQAGRPRRGVGVRGHRDRQRVRLPVVDDGHDARQGGGEHGVAGRDVVLLLVGGPAHAGAAPGAAGGVRLARHSEPGPGLGEDPPQDLLDLVELGLPARPAAARAG